VPKQDVPDILQNVSIELLKSIEKGIEIKKPKSWLFQVSRNLIADYYKQKSKSTGLTSNFADNPSEDFQPCICDIMEQIIQSVLPKKYSEPLLLSDFHKIPQKEIAKQLNINYTNTKSRIQRARKKVKDAFYQSVDFTYNQKGEIVGGVLKTQNNLPPSLIKKIKKLQLEH